MDAILDRLNIYMLPPFLSLLVGFSLAAISVIKGKFKTENVLFSLVCVWYSLISPVFI